MSMLLDFLGGAAQGGLDVAKAQMASDLKVKEAEAVEALREKFDQAKADRIKAQNVADATTVANVVQQKDTTRSIGLINSAIPEVPNAGEGMKPEDIARIRSNLSPEDQKKYYGLDPVSRSQTLGDSADASMGIGNTTLAKEFRGDAVEERKSAALDANTKAVNRKADIAQQLADGRDAKNENDRIKTENWMKVMLARMDKSSGDGSGKEPAAIQTARIIQEDEKARGNNISLAQAHDRMNKAADEGNNFAMNYLKVQSENGLIGSDKTKTDADGNPVPAEGKLYATPDDALAAGRKQYVNTRISPKDDSPPKATTPDAKAPKAPYPNGTRLEKKGPDGKMQKYVVRNGTPVLE